MSSYLIFSLLNHNRIIVRTVVMTKCSKFFSASPALLSSSFISSVFLPSGEQSQSQPVTKETDEKLLYIHTTIYISQTSLLSLSPTHTDSLAFSVTPANFTHTVVMTTAPNLYTPPPLHLCRRKSQLSCLSMSFHLSVCVYV